MDSVAQHVQTAQLAVGHVQQLVMLDAVRDVQSIMDSNIGARLAAEHERLETSVSTVAIGAYWHGRDHLQACRSFVERVAA